MSAFCAGTPITRATNPLMIAYAAGAMLVFGVATSARGDISISPPNPQPGSMISVSACIQLNRWLGDVPPRSQDPYANENEDYSAVSGVAVQLDGKSVNNPRSFGWCYPQVRGWGSPGVVGYGWTPPPPGWPIPPEPGAGQAATPGWVDNLNQAHTGTPIPSVLVTVGPGEHTLTITVEYRDGVRQQESKKISVAAGPAHYAHEASPSASVGANTIQWGGTSTGSLAGKETQARLGASPPNVGQTIGPWGSQARVAAAPSSVAQTTLPARPAAPVATSVTLFPTHGPNGSKVSISACGFPAPQGAQYDVAIDNIKAYMNLQVAGCGSGKFGFGTGTTLPPVSVTITGKPASRHVIDVTNLGTATFIVDP